MAGYQLFTLKNPSQIANFQYKIHQIRQIGYQTQHSYTIGSRRSVCRVVMQGLTIVGGGRVGLALQDMGDGDDALVTRDDAIESTEGPIIVCTRNEAMQGVVDKTPANRRKDLVFLQNGMIQPWLESQGLQDNTQVLAYFAVAKKGVEPIDGITDMNPEGLTAAWGEHAQAVADRLKKGNLTCKYRYITDRCLNEDNSKKQCLKNQFGYGEELCSSFMLIGAKHSVSVGEVESNYKDEVGQIITELAAAGEQALNIKLEGQLIDRLCAYSRSVASFPTAVKEFEWRNGWFYSLSQAALASGKPDPCPTHTELLKLGQHIPQ